MLFLGCIFVAYAIINHKHMLLQAVAGRLLYLYLHFHAVLVDVCHFYYTKTKITDYRPKYVRLLFR